MQVAQGVVNAGTSNGSTSVVTGLGFAPTCVILWTTGQTAAGTAAGGAFSFGASDGTRDRWLGIFSADASAANDTAKTQRDDSCIGLMSNSTTVESRATLDLDADGFTLTWTDGASAAYGVGYLALGGSGLANVHVGSVAVSATTGVDAVVTGLGFAPTHVMTFGVRLPTTALNTVTVNAIAAISATDGTNQWVAGMADVEPSPNTGNSTGWREHTTAAFLAFQNDTATVGRDVLGTILSLDADGFTIDVTNSPSGAEITVFYIAFDSTEIEIGTDTKPTTSTTKKTTTGAEPAAVLLTSTAWHSGAATTNGTGCTSIAVGALTATSQGSVAYCSDDAVGTSVVDRRRSDTQGLTLLDPGTPTIIGEADFSAFASDGFTLDWTSSNADAKAFGWVAFMADSGTDFPANLAGGITPTGASLASVGGVLGGAVAPAGLAVAAVGARLAGAVAPVGALVGAFAHRLSGAVTPSGSLAGGVGQPLGGSVAPTGTLTPSSGSALAGSVAPAGVVTAATAASLGGSVTPSGLARAAVASPLGGSVTPTGTLTSFQAFLANLAGAITPSGALRAGVAGALAGAAAPAGSLVASIAARLSGALTPLGTLRSGITAFVGGAINPAGTMTTALGAPLGGSMTPSGAVATGTGAALAGGAAPAGSALSNVGHGLAGGVGPGGATTPGVSGSLAGSITPTGTYSGFLGSPFIGPPLRAVLRAVGFAAVVRSHHRDDADCYPAVDEYPSPAEYPCAQSGGGSTLRSRLRGGWRTRSRS